MALQALAFPHPQPGVGSCAPDLSSRDLERAGVSWYYDWKVDPSPRASRIEFIPMVWSREMLDPGSLQRIRQSHPAAVLGFNEPDQLRQAKMSVRECLDLWPQLMALHVRLGSPAPAHSEWLDRFMAEVPRRHLRVDFVCLHYYPDFTDLHSVDRFEQILKTVHAKFRRPIWVTEFGAADVAAWQEARHGSPSIAQACLYMRKSVGMLNRLPYVERYAWFADRARDEYRFGSLFGSGATLTPAGQAYRDLSSSLGTERGWVPRVRSRSKP